MWSTPALKHLRSALGPCLRMVSGRPTGFYPVSWSSILHGGTLQYTRGTGANGNTLLLHGRVRGSTPLSSTPNKEGLLDRHHHEPLHEVLEQLLREQRHLVANTEALAAAVSANEAAVAANTTAVNAAVEAITSDADQAAVDAATTAVEASTTQVTVNTAALNSAVNPPVVPTVNGNLAD